MTNQEVTSAYLKVIVDLSEKRITIKESKALTKEIDVRAKFLSNRLKLFKTWIAVAKQRDELVKHETDGSNCYYVPAKSVAFYAGLEKYKEYNRFFNSTEYCCLLGHE